MQKRLFVVERGAKLGVFGDPIGEVQVGNRSLIEHQEETAARSGMTVERIGSEDGLHTPCFVMSEDTYVTPRFLSEFTRRSVEAAVNTRAGLATNALIERIAVGHPRATRVADGLLFDLWYRVGSESREECSPIFIENDDLEHSRSRVPIALHEDRAIALYESSLAILQIQDPVHLYQANMHQVVALLRELLVDQPRGFRTARGNLLGKNVYIHPSAWVEGSILGDGVNIDAQALVRHSIIGRDAQVFAQSIIERSVLGENALVHAQCRVLHSVLCADSFLSHSPFQFSFMGRGAAVFGTLPTDTRLDGRTVRTLIGGQVRDSGLEFLGLMVGHRAKVAAGVISAPGRVVENGAVVHPRAEQTFRG